MRTRIIKFVSKLLRNFSEKRSEEIFSRISSYIKSEYKILDVGTGTGHVTKKLVDHGYNVLPLDVNNMSVFEEIKPQLYNGINLPFKRDEFDVALFITVLHHVKDPEKMLQEASRVSKRVVIVEDIFNNILQKYLTFLMDSFGNLEFFGHPHTNKSDREWKEIFRNNRYILKDAKYFPFWKVFLSAIYYLERS